MRKVIMLIVSGVIIAGAYFTAFGVPAFLGVIPGLSSDADLPTGRVSGGRGTQRPSAGAVTVVLTPLEMQPYADILRAVGSGEAMRSAVVIAKVSGEITQINLSANQEVSSGDVLVQLDARAEEFNVEIAQAELTQARDTVLRYERLGANGNSTITDVALSEVKVVQRLAEAKLGLAEVALDDRTIRAPISGKMGLSDVEIGDILLAGSTVVTIDNSDALLVEFELPERSIAMLSRQQSVLASTPSFTGRVFEGEIVSFDSRIDSITRSVTVKARIENPDGLLWPGMTFAVRIIHESTPLAVLPSSAITWSRSGSSIWIEKDGVAEQVAVTILFRRNDQVWVEAEILPGTMVVTQGAQKLRPGVQISAPNIGTPVSDPPLPKVPGKISQAAPRSSIVAETAK